MIVNFLLTFSYFSFQYHYKLRFSNLLVTRRVTFVVAKIGFLSQKIGKVVGTYEWYLVSLWVQFE